jgi:hypothetical protein
MISIDTSAYQVTLSGRELALKRRKAMALLGKAGAPKAAALGPAVALTATPAMVSESAMQTMPDALSASVNVARRRRQALSQSGKGATAPATVPKLAVAPIQANPSSETVCGCGCDGAGTCSTGEAQHPVMAFGLDHSSKNHLTSPLDQVSSSRALARARRTALASDGKKGILHEAKANGSNAVLPYSDWEKAIEKGASGRDVAKQRRLAHALMGRQGSSDVAARPSGRMRAKNTNLHAPIAPVLEHTWSGKPAAEPSFNPAQKVTGAEYLSADQLTSICGKRPAPNPSKVAVNNTSRELKVTGTELGRTISITGQHKGADRSVTGTEYLSQQQCKSTDLSPVPIARKVSVMPVQDGQKASSVEVGRSSKVTGNEAGANRKLTGSQYFSAVDSDQPSSQQAPSKVSSVQTLSGSLITGTEVGRGHKVTGDKRGGCHAITGTEYTSTQQLEEVCETVDSVLPVAKVSQDLTWRDQRMTGTRLGRSRQVTGDEMGACATISGTAYIGQHQYQRFCEPEKLQAQQSISRQEGLISASRITGDRPGVGGSVMTGDQRGACSLISGSPYLGADNLPRQCTSSGRFVVPTGVIEPANNAVSPSDFSIRPPSRQAKERLSDTVTGSAIGNQRITGAVSKGLGLITGTPEFRHRDNVPLSPPLHQAGSGANKLTGEGSQAGHQISGDAWKSTGRVTGTEGTSSLARNPSQRGDARSMGTTAINFRKAERVEQPQSKVTGSSGNPTKGASITLSGGARG